VGVRDTEKKMFHSINNMKKWANKKMNITNNVTTSNSNNASSTETSKDTVAEKEAEFVKIKTSWAI
jgi:hypothetical protein